MFLNGLPPVPADVAPSPLSLRLRQASRSTHDRVDHAILQADPFGSLLRYQGFLQMQFAFHSDLAPLYLRADLQAFFPDLDARCRLGAIRQDAADLGIPLSASAAPLRTPLPLPEALGWLYVAEGSRLGAAVLFRMAQTLGLSARYGASHLSPVAEGPARQWQRFRDGLDGADLTQAEQSRAEAGAIAAFTRVNHWIGLCLSLPSG